MTSAVFTPIIGPEFDPFLFAAIAEGRNGTTVSVLSAFARTDVDPWREAASLARMSRQAATVRLAAFIVAMPESATTATPANMVAKTLVDLLPKTLDLGSPIPFNLPNNLPRGNLWLGLMFSTIAVLAVIVLMMWSIPLSPTHPGADLGVGNEQTSTQRETPTAQ